MGLFGSKEDSVSASEREADDARTTQFDLQLAEETKQRIEDLVAFNSELINPSRLKDSEFHKIIGKDFKISNLKQEDIPLVRLWQSLIDHLLFMGLRDTAKVFHAELIGFLAAKSSVEGFERQMLISTLTKMYKETKNIEPKKRSLL